MEEEEEKRAEEEMMKDKEKTFYKLADYFVTVGIDQYYSKEEIYKDVD